MNILAIDTSSDACSVALLYQQEDILQRFEIAPRDHSKLLLPMAESLLMEAGMRLTQLDAIAFARGPGSFTGLRIAAGVAQGMAFAAGLPVIPVSTLAALAGSVAGATNARFVLSCMDARMNEVYWGTFVKNDMGYLEPMGLEHVTLAHEIRLPNDGPWLAVGNAWAVYSNELENAVGDHVVESHADVFPEARFVASLALPMLRQGQVFPPEQAIPIYIRDNVVSQK